MIKKASISHIDPTWIKYTQTKETSNSCSTRLSVAAALNEDEDRQPEDVLPEAVKILEGMHQHQ